jgi:hypothetical protein
MGLAMIRRVGAKQAVKIRIYKKICDEKDRIHDGICFITGEPTGEKPEHHHMFGRDGELMIDEKYIVCVKFGHSEWWHDRPFSELAKAYWWKPFLYRLKELGKTDRMYHKIYLKYSDI